MCPHKLWAYEAAYFHLLIVVLQCIVKLGYADFSMETSSMSYMMALPRKGYLKFLFQMFAFMKNKHNDVIVFDPTEPDTNESEFNNEDWSATADGKFKE